MRNRIDSGDILTVTVDVFDTILLRKAWPEGLQFLEVADVMLPLFHKYINSSITAYEIYSWREAIH